MKILILLVVLIISFCIYSDPILNEDLLNAVNRKEMYLVEKLLDSGAEVNTAVAESGMTALHIAAKNGDLGMSILLLQKGAKIELQDLKYGSNTMHFAAESGNIELFKMLHSKGGSISTKNKNGNTPLHIACLNSKAGIVEYIVSKVDKSSVVEKDNQGITPLHLAAYSGNKEIVIALLQLTPNPDVKDNFGNTPLHISVQKGFIDIVKVLIEKKANINIKNLSGFAPLHYSVRNSQLPMVRLLLENGADTNLATIEGDTSLHIAAASKSLDIVQLLVLSGANISLKNSKNLTAIDIASEESKSYLLKRSENKQQYPLPCKKIIAELYFLEMDEDSLSEKSKAQIFKSIYNKNKSLKEFDTCLNIYMDDDKDRYLWIGTYLFDTNFTDLKEFKAAEKILNIGLDIRKEHPSNVTLYYTIGLLHWRQGKKDQSRVYFENAYELAKKYPDNIPAIPYKEREEIDTFLKIRFNPHDYVNDVGKD